MVKVLPIEMPSGRNFVQVDKLADPDVLADCQPVQAVQPGAQAAAPRHHGGDSMKESTDGIWQHVEMPVRLRYL